VLCVSGSVAVCVYVCATANLFGFRNFLHIPIPFSGPSRFVEGRVVSQVGPPRVLTP
jgi:hypothetical protein